MPLERQGYAYRTEPWYAFAACRGLDPELFFPVTKPSRAEAKQVIRKFCGYCPVRMDCLKHALRVPEEFGIWGGLTQREITRLRSSA
jgi:WhiB family transcriptional regulator, redox-sensing transcriptional regulator